MINHESSSLTILHTKTQGFFPGSEAFQLCDRCASWLSPQPARPNVSAWSSTPRQTMAGNTWGVPFRHRGTHRHQPAILDIFGWGFSITNKPTRYWGMQHFWKPPDVFFPEMLDTPMAGWFLSWKIPIE